MFLKIRDEKSFTLTELLLVVGLLAILTAFGAVNFISFKARRNFDLDIEKIAQAIRNAQERAIAQESGQGWSIRFTNSTSTADYFEIFSGNNYSPSSVILRDSLSSSSEFTNPANGFSKVVSFSAISGKPLIAQIVSLRKKFGEKNVASVFVSSSGQVRSFFEEGLIGYWPFDEGSGAVAYDASGSDNNGSIIIGSSGSQTTVTQAWSNGGVGKSGLTLNFDGTDDYINLPSINPISAITVSAWVKSSLSSGYSGFNQIISKYLAYILGTNSTGGKNICFVIYTNAWQYNPCYTVNDPQNWHHFVGTYNSNTGERKIYVDGILRGTATSTGNIYNDVGPIHLAHREDAVIGVDHLNGLIDDVRIYNRAFSDEEVKRLYESY